MLFVNSPLTPHITATLATKRPTTTLEMIDQINLGLRSAHDARMRCSLDYVVLMSKQRPIVAVVEMPEDGAGHLRLEVRRRSDGQEVVSSVISPTLGNRIQGIDVKDSIPRMIYCGA